LPEATSPELTKDTVRSVRPRTLQPPSLQCLSLQQDKDNSNIAVDVVPSVLTTPKKMFNSTFFLPLIALKSAIKRAAIVSASSLIALLKCY